MTSPIRSTSSLFAEPRTVRAFGDLLSNIWQLGYVTTDLDRAIDMYRGRLGVEHWVEVPSGNAELYIGDRRAEIETRAAIGTSDGPIIEIIEPVGGELDFYTRILPADGSFAMQLHHVATFIVPGDDEWDALKRVVEAAGLRVDYTVLVPGLIRAGYIDTTAELGHFVEVVQLEDGAIGLFDALAAGSVPAGS